LLRRMAMALAVLCGAALAAPAQNAAPPDLSGVWQINLPAFLKGGIVPPDQPAPAKTAPRPARAPNDPPYQPWAAEKVMERRENKLKDDPDSRCLMPGLPRIVNMPMPMQIIQTPQEVAILYEAFHSFRVIPTDGRGHIDKKQLASDGLYLGDSVGHWEQDTLVVDVTNFNDVTWLDNSGGIHSDALHVTERYRRPDRETLLYQATLDDPKVFTKPWTVNWTLKLRPGERLMEYECLENNQDPPRLVGK
jgi:hypothetical protein